MLKRSIQAPASPRVQDTSGQRAPPQLPVPGTQPLPRTSTLLWEIFFFLFSLTRFPFFFADTSRGSAALPIPPPQPQSGWESGFPELARSSWS